MSEQYEGQGLKGLREWLGMTGGEPIVPENNEIAERIESTIKKHLKDGYFLIGEELDDKAVVTSLPLGWVTTGFGRGAAEAIEIHDQLNALIDLGVASPFPIEAPGGEKKFTTANEYFPVSNENVPNLATGSKIIVTGTGAAEAHGELQRAIQQNSKVSKALLIVPPADLEERRVRALPEDEQKEWAAKERAKLIAEFGEERVAEMEKLLASDNATAKGVMQKRADVLERVTSRSFEKRLKRARRVTGRMAKGKKPKS